MSPFWKRQPSGPESELPSDDAAPVRPPVDLDQQVENPDLLSAIIAFASAKGPVTERRMQQAFNRAVFLVATDFSDATVAPTEGGEASQTTIQAGSKITMRSVQSEGGDRLLPIFSDWDAIRRWTETPVHGLVVPAAEVWSLALSIHDGAILNPAGPFIVLDRPTIQAIQRAGTA